MRKLAVSIFGTSASGLARRDSDLDLLLDLDGGGPGCFIRDPSSGFVAFPLQETGS